MIQDTINPIVERRIMERFARTVGTWDEAVQLGITLRQDRDSNSWDLGWLCWYENKDDNHSLAAFAAAIGECVGTLMRLRWLAAGFPPETVDAFPTLSASHFEVVRSLVGKRDGEGDMEAMYFLEKAADNNWTVAELRRQVNGTPKDEDTMSFPRFMAVGTRGVRIETVGADRGIFIPLDNDPDLYALVQSQFDKFLEYGPEIVEVTVRLAKP